MPTATTPQAHTVDVASLHLVRIIARRMKRRLGTLVELEDLEAHGVEGLLHAARRYQPGAGASFSTFAGYRIKGAMLDALPQLGPLGQRVSADPLEEHAADGTDAETAVLSRQDQAQVRRALVHLSPQERIFVERVYFQGKSLAEVGAELGLSRSWASRIHTRALGRLRRALKRGQA